MLALLLAFICATQAAAASAPRSFYGVMAADDPTSVEAAQMGAGKVGTLRINLVWAWVQPDSSTDYDWAQYDQVIGDAARAGIRVLPTIYGSPSWAALRENYPPWQDTVNVFRTVAFEVAQRYGAHGTFWAIHPEIPKLPVIWWQLWNEVSSSTFWYAKPKAAKCVHLLRTFRDGIKRGDPGAKILLAGLFLKPIAANSIPFKPYLRAIYKRGARPLFDGAARYIPMAQRRRSPYSASARCAGSCLAMATHPHSDLGYGGRLGHRRPSPLTVLPSQHGVYLVNTYRKLAAARERLNIAGVVWFSFRDRGGQIWFR